MADDVTTGQAPDSNYYILYTAWCPLPLAIAASGVLCVQLQSYVRPIPTCDLRHSGIR